MIRYRIKQLVPLSIYVFVRTQRERAHLNYFEQISCDSSALSKSINADSLREIFSSKDIDPGWHDVERQTSALSIGKIGGINFGDRRAIYYLIRHLCPRNVLEVGTHVGASTVTILGALQTCDSEYRNHASKLTTVDIRDVNDVQSKPWKTFGSKHSPREMAAKMGASKLVEFFVSASTQYLATCTQRFDFIFLDGNHAATVVYQELPLALKLLNPGGVILLHDYFPDLKPLWSHKNAIPGPWLATQRLKSEGARFSVLPLGELPWMTKFDSKVSSLALVVRE